MELYIHETKRETSEKAAKKALSILNKAIQEKGNSSFVIATGASQLDFIDALLKDNTIDWSKTRMFHLDEYINLSEEHPASFRKYLRERFVNKIDALGEVNFIDGEADDPQQECDRLNNIIRDLNIDVSFVGVGENGHLAFNDPPADFEVEEPFIIVSLDEDCKKQQVDEGWFNSIEEVPDQAISMSVKQIMKSENIICTVPGARKAQGVRDCFSGDEVSPEYPSSILKQHKKAYVYLDKDSAALLPDVQ